jgi:hypothetical protein
MARAKNKPLTVKAYITINGVKELWYEIGEDGTVNWFLPQDRSEALKQAMLRRCSQEYSLYLGNHPESSLWQKENAVKAAS